MTSGYKDLSGGNPNVIIRKQWSGSDTPSKQPLRENPYSMYGYNCIKGGAMIYKSVYGSSSYDPGWVNSNNPTVRWSSLELTALNRAISNVRGHNFSLPVALGEGRETLGMLAETFRKFTQAIKHAKRGNLSQAARLLGGNGRGLPQGNRRSALDGDDLASFWLGMRYGWIPALSDVYESSEAYRHKAMGDWATIGRGRSSERHQFEGSMNPTYVTLPCEVRYSVSVKLILTRELSLPQHLGLSNPWTVAWELLPLSFVFDWAMPLGDYLGVQNSVPSEGTKVVVTKRTLIRNLERPTSRDVPPVAPYYAQFLNGDQWLHYRYTKVDRTVSTWSAYETPKPEFVPPADLFNWKRVLDLAALGKSLIWRAT